MSDATSGDKDFRRMAPTVNKAGRINPTVADMVFVALNTPGYGGSQGLNMCIWSDPGGGKTSLVKEAAKIAGFNPYVIVLTRVAPEDITGIPRVIEVKLGKDGSPLADDAPAAERAKAETAYFTVKTPDLRFINISRDKKALVIFDDATNTTPAVQAAALDILLEKEFSDGAGQYLSLKHVPMVLMANHGEGASLTPFLAPVANRMMHVWMDNKDVFKWWQADRASQLTLDMKKVDTVAKEYPALLEKSWNLVNDYIKEKGVAAFSTPTPQDFPMSEDYAFATSRSYEFMVRWIAAAEHFGIDDARGIQGCIGLEKAAEFSKWRTLVELVNDAYARKIEWEVLKPDMQATVAIAAARRFQTDDQLSGLLASLKKLTKLSEGSQDVSYHAREYLLKRALGKEEPKLTANQIFLVRTNWPERFKALAGPADDARGVA